MNQSLPQRWLNLLLGVGMLLTLTLYQTQIVAQNGANGANVPTNSPEEHFNQGNITLAIQQWGREIKEGKNIAKALYNRSQAFILLHQYEFAVKDLDQLLELQGQKVPAEVYIVRGIALTEIHQLSAAIESFNHAERLDPSPLVYNNRAIAYERQGELNQALKDLKQSVKISPIPTHQINLANLQIQLEQYTPVINNLSQLLKENAEFFPAYITRGIAYYHLGQHETAIRDFVTALQFQPDQADAYYYSGLSFAKLNRKEEATKNLVRAANLYLQSNQAGLYHQVLEKMTELDLQ